MSDPSFHHQYVLSSTPTKKTPTTTSEFSAPSILRERERAPSARSQLFQRQVYCGATPHTLTRTRMISIHLSPTAQAFRNATMIVQQVARNPERGACRVALTRIVCFEMSMRTTMLGDEMRHHQIRRTFCFVCYSYANHLDAVSVKLARLHLSRCNGCARCISISRMY